MSRDANDLYRDGKLSIDNVKSIPVEAAIDAEASKPTEFSIGDQADLAKRLCEAITGEGGLEPVCVQELIYTYRAPTGIWTPWSVAELSQVIVGWSGIPVDGGKKGPRPLRISKGTQDGTIETARRLLSRERFFDTARPGIAFTNGFFALDTMQLEVHAATNRARVLLAHPFDEYAQAHRFDAACKAWFAGEADAADKQRLLLEVFGVALAGVGPKLGRALMLFGGRGTGKSTALKVLRALFPADAVCQIPPGKMEDDCHGAELAGRRLNIVFETPKNEILSDEGFKSIVQGEEITRRHLYQSPFSFTPEAVHVFACNELPPAPGVHEAFWDRWTVLGFDRVFRGESGEIKNLAGEIIAHELPGVIARAIKALRGVIDRGWAYTVPKSTTGLMAEWRREGDNVAAFLDECTVPIAEVTATVSWPRSSDIYSAYREFCQSNGFRPLSHTNFSRRLQGHGIPIHRSNGSRLGLRLHSDWRARSGACM